MTLDPAYPRFLADLLKITTGATVGWQLQRLKQWGEKDRKLRKAIQWLEASPEAARTEVDAHQNPKKRKKELNPKLIS